LLVVDFNLHKDQLGRRAGSPESAGLWALTPDIAEAVNFQLERLAGVHLCHMLNESSIDPDVDVGVIGRRRVNDLERRFKRYRLYLHDFRLSQSIGVRASGERWVVEFDAAAGDAQDYGADSSERGARSDAFARCCAGVVVAWWRKHCWQVYEIAP